MQFSRIKHGRACHISETHFVSVIVISSVIESHRKRLAETVRENKRDILYKVNVKIFVIPERIGFQEREIKFISDTHIVFDLCFCGIIGYLRKQAVFEAFIMLYIAHYPVGNIFQAQFKLIESILDILTAVQNQFMNTVNTRRKSDSLGNDNSRQFLVDFNGYSVQFVKLRIDGILIPFLPVVFPVFITVQRSIFRAECNAVMNTFFFVINFSTQTAAVHKASQHTAVIFSDNSAPAVRYFFENPSFVFYIYKTEKQFFGIFVIVFLFDDQFIEKSCHIVFIFGKVTARLHKIRLVLQFAFHDNAYTEKLVFYRKHK